MRYLRDAQPNISRRQSLLDTEIMPRHVKPEEISLAVRKGIADAFKSYTRMSGDWGLGKAPEAWIRACIARSIANCMEVENGGWVEMEAPVAATMKESRSVQRGIKPRDLRADGRFDLIIRFKNRDPRAVIEIKHPVNNLEKKVTDDIKRIASALEASQRKRGTLRDGFFAFYTACDRPKRKDGSSRGRLLRRIERFRKEAQKLAGDAISVSRNYKLAVVDRDSLDEWAWAAVVLRFKRHLPHVA